MIYTRQEAIKLHREAYMLHEKLYDRLLNSAPNDKLAEILNRLASRIYRRWVLAYGKDGQ